MLATFAGLAVLGVGTAAMALAGVHSSPMHASSTCQPLPAAPSSPPPSPTPSLSPGGGASWGGAANSTAPAAAQLCVSVRATTGTAQPGQVAQYKIDVWSTGGAADNVTVRISAAPSSFPAPAFTVCGSGDRTQTCKLGVLRKQQITELQAQDSVPKSASAGDSVTLAATATGVASGATKQGSVSGSASVRVVAAPSSSPTPTPSPTPTKHHHQHGHGNGQSDGGSGGSGSNSGSGVGSGLGSGLGPGGTAPSSDLSPLTGINGTGSGADPSNLFPTINPSPGASGNGGSPAATSRHDPYHPSAVADVLPLNTRQVGSQVAGLIVLAIGVVIALVRVSLRKPRTQDRQ